MKKRIISMLLASILAVGMLAGCGDTSASGGEKTEATDEVTDAARETDAAEPTDADGHFFAVLLPTAGGSDQFWTGINNAAVKRGDAEAANGHTYQIFDATNDASLQMNQAEDAINAGAGALLLAPMDPDGGVAIAQLAADAGIPVIVFNRELNDMTNAFGYCGLSEKETCMNAMEALCAEFNNEVKVGQITGISGHSGSEARKAGIEEVAAKYDGVEIVATQDGKFTRENAMNITLDWLQAGQEMQAIVAPGSEMAIGAAMAVEEYGLKPGEDIKIMSFDATAEGIRMMLEGKSNWDSYQDPSVQVNGAWDLALEALAGGAKHDIDIVGELVTKENVEEFAELNWPDMYAEWQAAQ